jgi:hypothetical protein
VLDNDLVSPTGKAYYPEGVLTIEKVFEGVSWGYVSEASSGRIPSIGDTVIRE